MKNENIKRTVFINSLFTVFQTIIDKFIFFIINMLIARYLDTSLFGDYTTSLAYATFFSTFTDIGIKSTLIRSIGRDQSNKDNHIVNAFFLKSVLAIIMYLSMALSLLLMNYSTDVVKLVLLFGFVRIGNEYMNLFYGIYSAHEKFIVQAISNSLFSFAILASTIVVILIKGSIYEFAFTRLFVVVIFITILAYLVLRQVKFNFSFKSLKAFLPQAYFFGLSSIYNNLYQRLNIIILSYLHGTLYSGYFSNAYMIFTTLFFIPNNINKVLIAHLYRSNYRDDPGKFQFAYDIYSKVFDIISIGISLLLFTFSTEIITTIYGIKYLPSAAILKVTALAIPLLFNVSGVLLTAIDRQDALVKIQKYALIINVVSGFILIKFFRGEGAALATVLTYLTLNQLYNVMLSRVTAISYIASLKNKSKIVFFAIMLGLIKHYVPLKIHFVGYSAIIGIIYVLLVYIVIIDKKELEIAREIFGKYFPKKKYIFFG